MMNVCVIPARGGSKRIPRKNIKDFHGKPMIAYSIEAALDSGCFDKVIVSTDDAEIAAVAKKYGAEVPFQRPKEISGDFATTMDVLRHAITWCEDNLGPVGYLCCVYATAPFVRGQDLSKGLELLKSSSSEYCFSATTFPFPIQRGFYLDEKGSVVMFQPEHLNTRSQDLTEGYHDAGQFYWGTASAFKEGLPFFAKHSEALILPRIRVQDIDTPEDWEVAEIIYAAIEK